MTEKDPTARQDKGDETNSRLATFVAVLVFAISFYLLIHFLSFLFPPPIE